MTGPDRSPLAVSHDSLIADGWSPFETAGFVELVGQIYSKEEGERVRYGFIAEPRFKNRRSVLHGGVLAAFADRTLALAGRRVNDNQPQATIELSMRFIDAVQVGEFVESIPEVVRKTRSIIFVRGTMIVGSRIVATADGIWKIFASNRS
jgi:acyl-coenzyme A thioesterase PaaI-like protein